MKFSISIKADPGIVFGALTTTKGFKGWWAKTCDIHCALNQISTVKFLKPEITEIMKFRTLEVQQDKRLVWQCIENNVFETWVGTTLDFKITCQKNHCLLTFLHTSPDKDWQDHPDYENSEAGWNYFINSLKQYCETGEGCPWG